MVKSPLWARYNWWLVRDVAWIAVIMLIATFGVATAIGWYQQGQWPGRVSMKMLGATGVFVVIALQNTAFVLFAWWRTHCTTLLGMVPQWRSVILWSLLGAPLLVIGNLVVGLIFALFGLQQNQAAAYPLVAGDYTGQLFFWLAAALIAPLGEELLFRGYLWGALQRHYGTWWAVIGTALLFAIGHSTSASQGAVVLVSQTLVMGVMLAWLRHMSGSVWAGVWAHAINNSIAVAIVTYCVNHPESGCARST